MIEIKFTSSDVLDIEQRLLAFLNLNILCDDESARSDWYRALVVPIRSARVEVRPKEKGHNRPHCHVVLNGEFDVSIALDTDEFEVIVGELPPKWRKHIEEFFKDKENRDLVMRKFEAMRPDE